VQDPAIERAIADATQKLNELFAGRLVGVALYGSAAGNDFVPGASDINLIVVLDELRGTDLRDLRPYVARWRRRGLATPLLVDRAFLRNATDVFPMELTDIQAQHRLLCGDDAFSSLRIRPDHLRSQCEREARGKLLRLRELYLEVGNSRPRLRRLMLDSLKTFLIIMRNLNRLRGTSTVQSYETALSIFAADFGAAFPVMQGLLRIRLGEEKWRRSEEDLFSEYLDEVRRFVRLIDQLGPTPAGDGTPSTTS
jgi:predicted nucleotidyltransferase